MIYDCFSFFNELDLLEIRLNILKDVVDKFVLVEASVTHTGKPKPFYFEENRGRFAAFDDKIIHVKVDDFSAADCTRTPRERAWAIENLQRNSIVKGLVGANPDDSIIISDLDEIPSPDAVRRSVGLSGITRLGMMQCNYFLNYRNYTSPEWTLGTQILSYATFADTKTYVGFRFNEFVIESVNDIPSASSVRFMKPTRVFHAGGWHFSYQGGVEKIQTKIKSIAHTEFDNDKTHSVAWIQARIANGEDVFLRGDRFFAEFLDERYPAYLRANASRYADMLLPVDEPYLRRTQGARRKAIVCGAIRRGLIRCVPEILVPFAVRVRNRMLKIR